ncbi:hypothetical protein GCM10017044_18380 [Kordiimonas sediminis]|uniref:DUF454 domain-containing protein n=1 Tax=Kordiimonas sediminis TaxID=1735581 RepID=A0A919AU07_9PROT|nr:YbaN family protein [Kordiimonas sediminis]GHF24090.1 hypothetical protein GCM10017044_18380 [Kordiimonas sediminis]
MRYIWILSGFTSLFLGILGIALPLLPTTPFLLLAAFCFARGSDRLRHWLVEHDIFGPPIKDWERYGAISRKGKYLAVGSLVAVILISVLLQAPYYVIYIQLGVLTCTGIFIVSRPLPPSDV